MKLITIEEHTRDTELGMATQKPQIEAAPFVVKALTPGLPYFPAPGVMEDVGENRLADMDKNGIDMQIISLTDFSQLLTGSDAITLTKASNDRLAEKISVHPDRFAAFATLPLSNPEAAATELERTIRELHFKGAMIGGRPEAGAVFLDDPKYGPVLEKAAELGVPIYVHPGFPLATVEEAYYERLDPIVSARLSAFSWGWHAEAGVQIIRMILAGVFEKYPNLQIIAGHWGEMVPFFLARLDQALPKAATHLPKTITEYYTEHVYVTPSGLFTLPQFLFTLQIMGADRIIYSVDYPLIGNEGARAFLENAPISQADKEKIAHGNAERLFKL